VNLPHRHLPFERLVDLVEKRLVGADAQQARSHLATCGACAASLATVERIVALMRRDALSQAQEEPPTHVVQRAVRLFCQRTPPARRLPAALLFDSAIQPLAAAGMRGPQAPGRQLIFTAGGYDLDLRLTPSSDGQLHTLRGQVLGPCEGAGRIELADAQSTLMEGVLDELCQFELETVPSGTYTLTLYLPEVAIELSEFELRSGGL
jgi:hypothetical protein